MNKKSSEENKRVGILISEEMKDKWQNFAEKNNFSTLSMLIRRAVNLYVDNNSIISRLENISRLTHDLKEPLTSIQGFSQLILENEAEDLNPRVLLKIKEIFSQSIYLEKMINEINIDAIQDEADYDVLIVDDDNPTLTLLNDYFESKGITSFGVNTGLRGLEELKRGIPKLILLDIILPDISGYDICKKIKTNDNLREIPVFYITAKSEKDVSQNLEETGAEGFLLKPFKFSQFKILSKYLKN
ncbi:MAG: response regulator [Promethearchaeota archaeon]